MCALARRVVGPVHIPPRLTLGCIYVHAATCTWTRGRACCPSQRYFRARRRTRAHCGPLRLGAAHRSWRSQTAGSSSTTRARPRTWGEGAAGTRMRGGASELVVCRYHSGMVWLSGAMNSSFFVNDACVNHYSASGEGACASGRAEGGGLARPHPAPRGRVAVHLRAVHGALHQDTHVPAAGARAPARARHSLVECAVVVTVGGLVPS